METVKIKFVSFNSPSFSPDNHWVTKTLRKRYNVEISDDPDFLFYSAWGNGVEHLKYGCVRVFCGGEPVSPNFNECDYAFGYEPIIYDDRYMQYPVGDSDSPGVYDIQRTLQDRGKVSPDMFDRKFCNFVYSQDWVGEGASLRKEFCKRLMEYKHVDCPSHVLNNMPAGSIAPRWTGVANGSGTIATDWSSGKIEFLKNYKFTIAFENTSLAGLTTEKLVQPFQAYSIPIYWGNPQVTKLFNPKAFINGMDYDGNFDAIIARVKEIDNDRDKYLEMLSQPPLQPDFDYDREKKAEDFLFNIIERGRKPFIKGAVHITSYHYVKREYDALEAKFNEVKAVMGENGCNVDSNSFKLLRKMQHFADSKWGRFPKRVFLFMVNVYRKLRGHQE